MVRMIGDEDVEGGDDGVDDVVRVGNGALGESELVDRGTSGCGESFWFFAVGKKSRGKLFRRGWPLLDSGLGESEFIGNLSLGDGFSAHRTLEKRLCVLEVREDMTENEF
ncbi:hypothetical protein Tco_1464914 [Tanacetum coccineum]